MGFSRQENWRRLPFPTPGDLPNPGIELHLLCVLHWQADSLPLSHLQVANQKKAVEAMLRIEKINFKAKIFSIIRPSLHNCGATSKEPACQCRILKRHSSINPGSGSFLWRRTWQPIPVFFPGEFHGQKSLVGYNLLGRKELDKTEAT